MGLQIKRVDFMCFNCYLCVVLTMLFLTLASFFQQSIQGPKTPLWKEWEIKPSGKKYSVVVVRSSFFPFVGTMEAGGESVIWIRIYESIESHFKTSVYTINATRNEHTHKHTNSARRMKEHFVVRHISAGMGEKGDLIFSNQIFMTFGAKAVHWHWSLRGFVRRTDVLWWRLDWGPVTVLGRELSDYRKSHLFRTI